MVKVNKQKQNDNNKFSMKKPYYKINPKFSINMVLFILFTIVLVCDAFCGILSLPPLIVKSPRFHHNPHAHFGRSELRAYSLMSPNSMGNYIRKSHTLGIGDNCKSDISNYKLDATISVDNESSFLRILNEKIDCNKKAINKYKQKLKKFNEEEVTLQNTKSKYLKGTQLGKLPPDGMFHETALRSAVKSIVWRIIAGSVTFFTSLRFSRNFSTAIQIVGSDFFSKAFTMFLGERLMNKSQFGRKSGSESARRSFLKALLWRLFAICNTMVVSLFFAKDLEIASKIAGSDAIVKTMLMFLYERFWSDVRWGKEYLIDFSI